MKKLSTARYLSHDIRTLALDRNKMAFISGPRQAGKTTLAKSFEQNFDQFSYQNWDETSFQRMWAKNPNQLAQAFDIYQNRKTKLLVLDEIHKSKNWKQKVKGIYDQHNQDFSIIVTGSARLNVYKKGGDSLLGRYFHFRLHTFTLSELLNIKISKPEEFLRRVLADKSIPDAGQNTLERLYHFGGFPEPYFAKNEKILNLWRRGRLEKVVREDLRDLTRIQEIGQVELLTSLLPERVGSPLSVASLREDLDVSFDTVKRWLKYLQELYYLFEIKPYSKSIPRSIKKEGKFYLYDWTEISDKGYRFENLVACHILKACQFWEDTGEGIFQLCYLRDKEKQEVDFLIVKNKKPWLSIECKYGDHHLSTNYKKFQKVLGTPHIQVVFEPGIWRKIDPLTSVMSANKLLGNLV